jgi:hypothetical protein
VSTLAADSAPGNQRDPTSMQPDGRPRRFGELRLAIEQPVASTIRTCLAALVAATPACGGDRGRG